MTNAELLYITDIIHVISSTSLSVYNNFADKHKINKSQDVYQEYYMKARYALFADSTTLTECK
jgi:hypothetical protein